MKNGSAVLLPLADDSLHVEIGNKSLKKASRQIHIPLKNQTYVLIYVKEGNVFKALRDSIIIQEVCQECFEQIRKESDKRRR